MHNKSLYKSIERLPPELFTDVARLGDENLQRVYRLYTASLNGQRVAIKPSSNFGSITEEANVLHLLQGATGVPKLYGVLGSTLYAGGHSIPPQSVVEELATGTPIYDMSPAYRLFEHAGYNIFPEIISEFVRHINGCMEKGLLVGDIKSDMFVDFGPDGELKLTRVDYGHAVHVEAATNFTYGEFVDKLLGWVLAIHAMSPFYDSGLERSGYRSRVKSTIRHLREKGEQRLPDLLDSFDSTSIENESSARDEYLFYSTTGGLEINTPDAFLQFLQDLEKAAREHSEFNMKNAPQRMKSDIEQILRGYHYLGWCDKPETEEAEKNELEDVLMKLHQEGYRVPNSLGISVPSYGMEHALMIALKLGSIPPYLREAVAESGNTVFKAVLARKNRSINAPRGSNKGREESKPDNQVGGWLSRFFRPRNN